MHTHACMRMYAACVRIHHTRAQIYLHKCVHMRICTLTHFTLTYTCTHIFILFIGYMHAHKCTNTCTSA